MTRICRFCVVYTASTASLWESRRARPRRPASSTATAVSSRSRACFSSARRSSCCLNTTLSCSKKQKKIALLMPLENALGPTPVKNVLTRPAPAGDSRHTAEMAPANDGRCDALHIIRVLTTSSGVVAPAATAPAMRPMEMSAAAAVHRAHRFVRRELNRHVRDVLE